MRDVVIAALLGLGDSFLERRGVDGEGAVGIALLVLEKRKMIMVSRMTTLLKGRIVRACNLCIDTEDLFPVGREEKPTFLVKRNVLHGLRV